MLPEKREGRVFGEIKNTAPRRTGDGGERKEAEHRARKVAELLESITLQLML